MEPIVDLPLWSLIPFVLMLLTIAIAPLFADAWWGKNVNKLYVSLILGIPTAIYLICVGLGVNLEHQILYDYLPFIILLASLFVVTGGIHMQGNLYARPSTNTAILAIGYVLASLTGTTGAAMLLIRPLLATNKERKYTTHTVLFFIAAVANCGGLLTPLGDPPLFLLFLRGASFTWFLNLFPAWLLVGVLLLTTYYILDSYWFKRESLTRLKSDARSQEPIRIKGDVNFLFLFLIILTVAFVNAGYIPAMGEEDAPILIKYLREIALCVIIALSLMFTHRQVRIDNNFTWNPIIEVAVVFLGIFITMTPAMLYLKGHAASLGLTEPWQFFYSAGMLSSVLDNAPTALAFHGVASGLVASGAAAAEVAGIPEVLLKAIALGSVMFGAMTYIGNGPNFMVKAIAEESGFRMPSFFGYIWKFSLRVLLPIYVLVQLIFFFF